MRIDKSIRNELFYQDINQRLVYIHLALSVNTTQSITPKGGKIEAGQTIIGYDYLAKDIGITTSKTRTALSKLQNQVIITLESVVRVGTVVTMLGFEREEVKPKVKKVVKESKSLEDRVYEFKSSLVPYLEKYGKTMLSNFSDYWCEKSPKGKLMRFEKEKVFEASRRLSTWSKNNFNSNEPKITQADDHLLNHVNKFKGGL